MKKILTAITTIALLASLTACNNVEGTPTGSNSEPVSQTSETSTDTDSQNSETSSDNTSDDDIKAQIEAFHMDDFPAPDGTILKKADATMIADQFAVGYEFAYMRKVQPIFVSTLDDPNAFDWDNMEFTSGVPEIPEDLGWFKIKAGDVLDNGLTVKSAEVFFGEGWDGILYTTSAEFEGELTLEGVLYCYPEDGYNIDKGAVIFFPNTAKYPELVTPYDELDHEPDIVCDPDSKFALLHSGKEINIVNSALPNSISELFAHDTAVKAAVTLTDLKFRMTTTGVRVMATVKAAELL